MSWATIKRSSYTMLERSSSIGARDVLRLLFFFDEKASRCSLSKSAKSTISICAPIFLFTILLFMLSTFDSGRVNSSQPSLPMVGPQIEISFSKRWRVLQSTESEKKLMPKKEWSRSRSKLALHGMGNRRNTSMEAAMTWTSLTQAQDVNKFLHFLYDG